MEKKFQKSLFIFRRDLRLEDNTGLIFALYSSKTVIPAFIFTPEQIDHNPFRSDHCLKFMIESLKDLEEQLEKKKGSLFFFKGKPEKIVEKCILQLKIDALIVNRDYTPYSKQRDEKLEHVCKAHGIAFYSFEDALLHPPETTLKKEGKPYTVFTPYFHNASQIDVSSPAANRETNYAQEAISFAEKPSILSEISPTHSLSNGLKGGRKEALKILKQLSSFEDYNQVRDFPAQAGSTHLSAYLKFTVCSAREIYASISHHLGAHHDLIRSLYWRDFFTGIAFFYPHVFQGAFYPKFDKLKWSSDENLYERWCTGTTGFPIVDAGMREMNETGFMHNRVRMIAASFLIKDLHLDWRWGEKYFAQTLIDYDPAVNNGNWQWVASTGSAAQPYFRIFNPWSQQKKFDPECAYIKQWVPELRSLSSLAIHKWGEENHSGEYPLPLIDHEREAKESLKAYKALKS